MGMVAPCRGIGSAFFVCFGKYGDVSRFAQEQGVSRQWVYREARQVADTLGGEGSRQEIQRLNGEVASLREQLTQAQARLDQSVLVDAAKQAEFACVGQACGVTLSQGRTLLGTLIRQPLSVATLGRATHEMGQKAGTLLAVLDEFTRPLVRDAAADEIYVKDPTLMIVEQESLCWVCGRLSADVSGATWSAQFSQLPNMEQVARDGGKGLAKGVALVNAQRQEKGQEPVVDQGDHFHAFRPGGVGLGRSAKRAQKALTAAEEAQKDLEKCARQGQALTGPTSRARHAWLRAEQAMDEWVAIEQAWTETKEALRLITPEGELNTRAQAEAKLAETLPHLPEADFAKAKRQVQLPEMLNYLDRVEKELGKLELAAEVKQAAIDQEALRRRPELLQGETAQAAARRGVLLMCAVILSKAGEAGTKAVASVREIFRRAHRASSLVECLNSVLRMHQAQHRKMSQEMVDLKRLYWNSHEFRTGHRRGQTPYQLLGVPWPEGMCWWELLKLTPEQLREKLSTMKNAA
jgi:hypothetical protein